MSAFLKKIISFAILLSVAIRVSGPGSSSFTIFKTPPVEPFRSLIHAVGMVETKHDTLSFNPVEQAAGYFQIRPIRLLDFNRRTGSKYSIKDLFFYKVSEEIFLYYASEIGPYNFERIAKNWNGKGKETDLYWDQVRKFLR
jgi:hypothetical protein